MTIKVNNQTPWVRYRVWGHDCTLATVLLWISSAHLSGDLHGSFTLENWLLRHLRAVADTRRRRLTDLQRKNLPLQMAPLQRSCTEIGNVIFGMRSWNWNPRTEVRNCRAYKCCLQEAASQSLWIFLRLWLWVLRCAVFCVFFVYVYVSVQVTKFIMASVSNLLHFYSFLQPWFFLPFTFHQATYCNHERPA